jgi:hypothetical protein
MSFDKPRHEAATIDVPTSANPQVSHLEVLAHTIGQKYPAIRARLDPDLPGRPATLRTAYAETFENIECDYTDDGWYYCWSSTDNPIGPVTDPSGAAFSLQNLLGLRTRM